MRHRCRQPRTGGGLARFRRIPRLAAARSLRMSLQTRDAPVGESPVQVAVVTVCRNALADLKLTVASVQGQTFMRLLHIVVDGASTDGTTAFLRDNAALFHVASSEPDNGIYDAMNKAIAFCPESAWVVFLNAGDWF